MYYILYAPSSASQVHMALITLPPTAQVRWISARFLSKWCLFLCAGILGQAATYCGLTDFDSSRVLEQSPAILEGAAETPSAH